jgi:predicted transposase/invertase (TIGR01784 family)
MADKPKALTTPHDRLFHRVFGERENAIAFFKKALPPRIAKHIDWGTMQALPQKVVEEALGKGRLDLVFSVRIAGRPALLAIICEHQTSVEYWMASRMAKYVLFLGEWWRGQHKETKKLPLVLPFVLYHGKSPWTAPLNLRELVDIPPELGEDVACFVPDFTYLVEDLHERSDESIKALWEHTMVRLVLQLFKHVFDQNFVRKVREILHDSTFWLDLPRELQALRPVLSYVLEVIEDPAQENLKEFERALGPHAEGFVMTVAEQLREEGREEGHEKGREQGEQIAMARSVLEVFEARAVAVPSDIRERILDCKDLKVLQTWLRRAITAQSAGEIFDV